MRKERLTILFVLLISLGCDHDGPAGRNSYTGTWAIAFEDASIAAGYIDVRSNGTFFEYMDFQDSSGSFANIVSGIVTVDGVTTGKILQGGSQVGSFSGNFSVFTNLGAGSWQTNRGNSGTWTGGRVFF